MVIMSHIKAYLNLKEKITHFKQPPRYKMSLIEVFEPRAKMTYQYVILVLGGSFQCIV